MHVARAKRGKTRASKSPLVLVLLLIGRGSGARFFNQSQSVAMQNQSNCGITFDTQLKTALYQTQGIVCHQDFQTPMKWVEKKGAADFFKLTSKFLDTW